MATPLIIKYKIIYTSKYANIQYRITIQNTNILLFLLINSQLQKFAQIRYFSISNYKNSLILYLTDENIYQFFNNILLPLFT